MKVVGLAPQFIQSSAPGVEKAERVKTAEELQRLRIVKSHRAEDALSDENQDAAKEGMDQQTRAGLRRLAQMIREARKPANDSNEISPIERKRKFAIDAYRNVVSASESFRRKGGLFDKIL
jgi:hypothetical protein